MSNSALENIILRSRSIQSLTLSPRESIFATGLWEPSTGQFQRWCNRGDGDDTFDIAIAGIGRKRRNWMRICDSTPTKMRAVPHRRFCPRPWTGSTGNNRSQKVNSDQRTWTEKLSQTCDFHRSSHEKLTNRRGGLVFETASVKSRKRPNDDHSGCHGETYH
mmetsp:Transcript_44095/g.53295  ORF Transcript_44095/g.53295 Transcript_44095/m.53295 type:complete len:162 (-) Transcript_44095:402-887(-)